MLGNRDGTFQPDATALYPGGAGFVDLRFPVIDGNEHRDPFDRLLISQARVEGMHLVSGDRKFPAYGVPIIW
jgi:hypothetical protein